MLPQFKGKFINMSKVGGLEKRKSTGRKRRSRPWFSSVLTFVSVLGASATPAASIASSIDYRYFVAGGTCAAISHGITCPIGEFFLHGMTVAV